MRYKYIFVVIVVLFSLLGGSSGFALARISVSENEIQTQDPELIIYPNVDASFTYQGVLKENGQPVTGWRDFTFFLSHSGDCSTLLYDISKSDVPVTNGLFSVELMVSNYVFNGEGVWIQAEVDGTKLACQKVTAVPYAMSLVPGAWMLGDVMGDEMLAVVNRSDTGGGSGITASTYAPTGRGVVGSASSSTGINYGVLGGSNSPDGYGVYGANPDGIAVGADGAIQSTADSTLYLSPHDMVIRMDENSGVTLTPLQGGGVRVQNTSGGISVEKYLSIPISTFGTLFGSQVYVKSLDICYKASSLNFISATTVSKNSGSETGEVYYIYSTDYRDSTTYDCYSIDATTPRKPIDNSSWVQLNMHFNGQGSSWNIFIYTVKLTLTESPN